MAITPHHNRLEQRLSGAYIDLDDMISARFAAKDLKLQQRRKALSLLAGPNKTNFRGRGIDFEEVRAYQAGDDIRTIDWRVTARSGKAYTKLFQEERERPMLVVTDQRQSMFFGSQTCFKSVMACYLGALIAWSGLQNSDRVGGLVFGNQRQQEIRPRRSRQSALALIHLMLEFNQALNKDSGLNVSSAQRLEEALIELRRIARPGSTIYIISDFAGFNDGDILKHLHQLSRHCEITALTVVDPLEKQLPPPGQYTVTDGSQRHQIHTGSSKAQHHYAQQFAARQEDLKQQLGKLGIPLIEISTEQPPLQHLLRYYGTATGVKR
ncbi:DUF58 domain-containing protein [Oceanicoccus sagamiensis]|uniref:DUF58 domain-containing protein n=1 Tax=Oceanicoccus sagamiensis TaxID=716816 RepID=A0A1X9NG77_9GAMM|nr:DUF58 domain-containing protein [Oceanicoccus sagamiensis]ARN76171.1 hypothetical protein BST96_19940 [Oceanicoccus sagamiensis]